MYKTNDTFVMAGRRRVCVCVRVSVRTCVRVRWCVRQTEKEYVCVRMRVCVWEGVCAHVCNYLFILFINLQIQRVGSCRRTHV